MKLNHGHVARVIIPRELALIRLKFSWSTFREFSEKLQILSFSLSLVSEIEDFYFEIITVLFIRVFERGNVEISFC